MKLNFYKLGRGTIAWVLEKRRVWQIPLIPQLQSQVDDQERELGTGAASCSTENSNCDVNSYSTREEMRPWDEDRMLIQGNLLSTP